MSKSHDTFISYSSQDKLIANALCHYLENKKIRCWIAPRDIMAGVDYAQAIVDGIEKSSIMIVIFSSATNNSKHVRNEVQAAFNNQLVIIPFRIENIQPNNSLNFFLASTHWLDAFDNQTESYFEKLYQTCHFIISTKYSGNTTDKNISTSQEIVNTEKNKSGIFSKLRSKKNITAFSIIIFLVLSIVVVTYIMLSPIINPKTILTENKAANTIPDSIATKKIFDSVSSTNQEKISRGIPKTTKNEAISTPTLNKTDINYLIGNTYEEYSSTDNISLNNDGSLNFSGNLAGYSLSGKLIKKTNFSFTFSNANCSGVLNFSNDYNNISGNIIIKSISLSHPLHLVKSN